MKQIRQHCHHRPRRPRQNHWLTNCCANPVHSAPTSGLTTVMDSNDLEKNAALPSSPKNTAIDYEGYHQHRRHSGHADLQRAGGARFGYGGLRRIVGGCAEGPMPQTRFSYQKALALGLKPIVVINKIDKPSARPSWVIDQAFELSRQLGRNRRTVGLPDCLRFRPVRFRQTGRNRRATTCVRCSTPSWKHTPAPSGSADETLQLPFPNSTTTTSPAASASAASWNSRIKPGCRCRDEPRSPNRPKAASTSF